jgi:5-methylcytosine-specific restriction enzyme subunit McrC
MMKIIDRYEHGRLMIGEEDFKQAHWDAFVKLNNLHQDKYFDVLPKGIKFKQFVGVIQVDGLLVQIHPKADKDDLDGKWRFVLLDMLQACGRLKAQTVGNANLKKQHLNLLEVYFEYFLREVESLIHHGLVKKYSKETGNVKALKGKLEFAGNIRHNLVHKERFYTTHQVYDVNHKLHQVLALALSIVDQFSRGTNLADFSKRVRLAFPEVNNIQVNEQVLNAIKLDRKTAPYERALELAKLIILNYSPDINQGKQKMIALMFDMNELWEEYVLVQLRKTINNTPEFALKYQVKGQTRKYLWNYNYIQPDIEITKKETNEETKEETKETFIIDTKWKRPGYSASVEDLRQIYTYARFWDAKKVMLLYPGNSVQNRNGLFLTDDYKSKVTPEKDGVLIEHTGMMSFVSVLQENQSIEENTDEKKKYKLNEFIAKEILELLSNKV